MDPWNEGDGGHLLFCWVSEQIRQCKRGHRMLQRRVQSGDVAPLNYL